MSTSSFTISGLVASHSLIFNQDAVRLGFSSVGEIDRFVFSAYAKAIKNIRHADRLRGAIFVLEPASAVDTLCAPSVLKPLLMQIQAATISAFHSLRVDIAGGLSIAYMCQPTDRQLLVSGEWPRKVAEQFSRNKKKCVVWAEGVSAVVYINGALYLESPDVVEEFTSGVPIGFQGLSWDDGAIVFELADGDLNDTGPTGIWQLADKYVLRPKPEVLIRSRLGAFLRYRLAGFHHHDEEAHVENEGRADVSLHLIDGRILIVEIKWIGCSLVGTHIAATEEEIKQAIAKNAKGWLTKFDDATIASGVRQLVRYYKTGRYRRAYLAVFDCSASARSDQSCYVPVPSAELDGHSNATFRILRACVDPRPASRRSR